MSGDVLADTFLSRQQINMVPFFFFACVFICLAYSKEFTYGLLAHSEITHRQVCWQESTIF